MKNCFYCNLPMPEKGQSKKDCLDMIGIKAGAHGSAKAYRYFKKTKEHIVRKADGGTNKKSNIAMAHYYCNVTRGSETVERHKMHMLNMVDCGAHPFAKLRQPQRICHAFMKKGEIDKLEQSIFEMKKAFNPLFEKIDCFLSWLNKKIEKVFKYE